MNAQINSLQEQVDMLFANMSSLRASEPSISTVDAIPFSRQLLSQSIPISQNSMGQSSPSRSRPKYPLKHPRFQGPTSSAFSIDVAKNSLQTMGITGPDDPADEGINTHDGTPLTSPPPILPVHPSKDALWSIGKDEAIRLLRVYEEEMGIM